MSSTFAIGNIQNYHEATVADARRAVHGLDGVAVVPLYRALYRAQQETYAQAENVFGVLNTATDKIAMPVSDRYRPISHADGFNPALDAIEHAGIGRDMLVCLENHRNTAELYVLFPELMFNEDREGGGMMYGLRFRNQYDQKTTFRGHVFCWRVACQNGSTHARLGELSISAMHVESHIDGLRDQIDNFITSMLSNSRRIERVIDDAIESPINFRDDAEMIRTLTTTVTNSDRHSRVIARNIPRETNRWQMFNAITEHASHAERMSWQVRDRLLDAAERKVLMVNAVEPIPAPMVG